MALTEKEVRYVAELAHLHLTEEEVRQFLPQLDSILEYVAKLNELNLEGIEPMAQVLKEGSADFAFRPDVSRKTFSTEEALRNAPERGDGLFKVPRVIERE
ncbi:MAG TPA: Asp-tRNA(Asn)/Glu-tRNA(Gln) amidotransferase subunit GatC [Terriglobia bacterium]|nr:Asp-tRNA(Asn)/Glu-tRNA(Gln) amidotransferase subunit GatC [Terriglobia bacterium]